MVVGVSEEGPERKRKGSESILPAAPSDTFWSAPIKPEPRWVEYITDNEYSSYGVPRVPLESAEPPEAMGSLEGADLPDLDFVPAQDLIPEMVLEGELGTPVPHTENDVEGGLLIPIQGSIVAHSRAGKPSSAAVSERRAKNTEAARRSRARRADKLYELRQRNDELCKRNVLLVAENEQLRAIVRNMEDRLRIQDR